MRLLNSRYVLTIIALNFRSRKVSLRDRLASDIKHRFNERSG